MSLFIALKYIHIFSAIVMAGLSTANGMMEIRAMRQKDSNLLAFSMGTVEFFNRFLVLPALIVLPVSGILLALTERFPLTMPSIIYAIILTAMLFVAYFLGSNAETELKNIAEKSQNEHSSFPERYKQVSQRVLVIGGSASVLVLLVLYIMVAKL